MLPQLSVNWISIDDLKKELERGASLIRFGDGEASLILGKSIYFQKYEEQIGKQLKRIMVQYSQNTSNYILSVPLYLELADKELELKGMKKMWTPFKILFSAYSNKKTGYLDAHIFYRDSVFIDVVVPIIKNRHVIVVTGNADSIAIWKKTNPSFAHISYIETPKEHAFDDVQNIKKDIDRCIDSYSEHRPVILFSCGPAGKILAGMYAEKGIQSLDIGKGLEVIFTTKSLEHELV